MELKEITTALYEWADQSEKRNVLCIATEKRNETEEGYSLSTSTAINGKKDIVVDALVNVMQKDKKLADIIGIAFLEYSLKNANPIVSVGVSVKAGEEDDDE